MAGNNSMYEQLKNMLQSNGSVHVGYMGNDEIEYFVTKLRSENIDCTYDEDNCKIVKN